MTTRTFCVAPMMEHTDRHDRYFLRLISRHTLLYTEMITTGALRHGDASRLLTYDPTEHPVAVQLGGSDPHDMAECGRMVQDWGYDEVNINVGCPSDRVQSGRFGACLMEEPEKVATCVDALSRAVDIPVTVKTRIGIDQRDSYEDLVYFVETVAGAGCRTFIIHARKAWLQGLSPKENREIPPIRHDVVRKLKQDLPQLEIIINGGITTLEDAQQLLGGLDGVMLGREAYRNPYLLAWVDRLFFNDQHPIPSRFQIVERFIPYVEQQLASGVYLSRMTRHILGLFQGVRGAKAWRRHMSENAHRTGAGVETIRGALRKIPAEMLYESLV